MAAWAPGRPWGAADVAAEREQVAAVVLTGTRAGRTGPVLLADATRR